MVKVSLQIDSFQEAFEVLSKSFTISQMINNFLQLLKTNFLPFDIYLFHRTSSDSEWTGIGEGIEKGNHDLSFLNKTSRQIDFFENNKYDVSVVLPLSDSSWLGILLKQKPDGTEFSDIDKITLLIFLQVFDSAHKAFLNQKKEKELIFELNEKIFQLNNLIDTGIRSEERR